MEGVGAALSLLGSLCGGAGRWLAVAVAALLRPVGCAVALGVEEPEPLPAGDEGMRGVREVGIEEVW